MIDTSLPPPPVAEGLELGKNPKDHQPKPFYDMQADS